MYNGAVVDTFAERLLELLQEEIQLAVDDGWDIENLEFTLEKFNF